MMTITYPDTCPHCKETNEPWLTLKTLDTLEWDCCGKIQPLTASDLVIDIGKYKGLTLDEVADESYLRWMKKTALENDNSFVVLMVDKKLK
jgi:hypothetical protein